MNPYDLRIALLLLAVAIMFVAQGDIQHARSAGVSVWWQNIGWGMAGIVAVYLLIFWKFTP